ncbi:MAG: hypothetical protein KAH97_10560, partial [Anaerolineales bacterium]|nr:hypothetical protein [Anaerolineales bacterium]
TRAPRNSGKVEVIIALAVSIVRVSSLKINARSLAANGLEAHLRRRSITNTVSCMHNGVASNFAFQSKNDEVIL